MSVAEAFVTVRPDTDKFGGELKSKLGGLATVAAGAGIAIGAAMIGASVKGVRAFADLQAGMNEVFTLLPGITEEAMGQMTDEVREFSKFMGVATDEVVPALYQALSAGVPQDTVFDFLETATQASVGGLTSLETAVDGITSVVNAYGAENLSARDASDALFTTVRLGKTDFEQLASSVFQVAPIASAAGVSFDEVGASIATLTGMGTPTSVAMTQIRSAISEMTKEGTSASDVFKEMAGKTFPEFMAAGGTFEEALGLMAKAAEDSGLSVLDMFGSVEAGQAVLGLTGQGAESFTEALAAMEDKAYATERAYDTMNQGLSRSWDRIKVNLNDLFIELGERLAPALQAFADWFEQNLPNIVAWFEDVGARAYDLGERFGEFAAAVHAWWTESAKPAIEEFVAAVKDNWPTIEGIIESLGSVFTSLGEIADSALTIVSAAFGRTTSDVEGDSATITDRVDSLVAVLDGLATAAEWTSGRVSGAVEVLAGLVTFDFDRIGRASLDLSGGKLPALVASFMISMQEIADAVRRGVDDVVEFFKELPGRIVAALPNPQKILLVIGRQIIGGLFDGMKERWDNAKGWLSSRADEIRDLKGPIEKDRVLLEDVGREIIGGLGRGMEQEWANVERLLGTMTAEIPLDVAAPNAAAGGRSTDGVHFHGPVTVGSANDLHDLRYQMKLAYAEAR
jgi:TP901 family phage tail tape measure protein